MHTVENPPHSKFSPTFKSEGEQSFLWMVIGKSTMPSTPLKRVPYGKVALQKNPPEFGGGTFLVVSSWNSDTLARIASNSIKTIHVSNTCPVTFLAKHWDEKRETLDKGETFGAVKNRAVVLGYSTVNGRGCWPRKLIRGHLFSSPKQKAPAAFAQLVTS